MSIQQAAGAAKKISLVSYSVLSSFRLPDGIWVIKEDGKKKTIDLHPAQAQALINQHFICKQGQESVVKKLKDDQLHAVKNAQQVQASTLEFNEKSNVKTDADSKSDAKAQDSKNSKSASETLKHSVGQALEK